MFFFFFSSRRRHTRCGRDWSSDVCSSDLFGEPAAPYLVSVECGELATSTLPGAAVDRKSPPKPRGGLEWRGYVLARHASPRRSGGPQRPPPKSAPAGRAAWLETAQKWAGLERRGTPPSTLSAAA